MTPDGPLAEFEIGSGTQRGSRLTLYANRLVHQGGDSMETVPLAQLAAVRGRNRFLVEFAQTVAGQLAVRRS